MSDTTAQKISISLPGDLLRYAETYQKEHGLRSRSDVMAAAVRALRELELIESYKAMKRDYEANPDAFELSLADGLEPSTEADW